MSTSPELDDQNLRWLAQQAPQFHTPEPEAQPEVDYVRPEECSDDSDSDSPDSEGSDSDEDPTSNYHVPNTKWVVEGGYAYAADDADETYMSRDHVVDDAPYDPPVMPGEDNAHRERQLSPDYLAPSSPSPFTNPYASREFSPQDQQEISPRALSSMSSARARASRRTSSRRTRAHEPSYDTMDESDADVSVFESASDSEDEYRPSPKPSSRRLSSFRKHTSSRTKVRSVKRNSYSPYPSSSASTPSSIGESSSASSSRRPGSRNVQIFDREPPPRGSWDKTGPDAYKCPFCDHVQTNKRSPDMERHIRSHFRSAVKAQWVCCGVPIEDAAKHAVSPTENRWTFNGRVMVGGCHEDFSRMDALKRHWKNRNNTCVGDIKDARVKVEE
ncbi:hypothetical protein K466DRAFT_545070 [Polyporus arcularius HHB13444]|uniref:Uncharacterized protein n=1 Tax=Polyporus arcularius HHB13444 TaxID=1314778 RepID=A0A5C3PJ49_9APHY|nr:hypothetical protein K466DRAFT_545070 [Polyporus arcularius HHB13444]